MMRKLLAMLPKIEVSLYDWHLQMCVGEQQNGFTAGPRFLAFYLPCDKVVQVISPPEGYVAPMSEICFDWNSKEGVVYAHFPPNTSKVR